MTKRDARLFPVAPIVPVFPPTLPDTAPPRAGQIAEGVRSARVTPPGVGARTADAAEDHGDVGWDGRHYQWLLRADQVAAILQVSVSKIYLMLQRNELPIVRLGKSVRVPADALADWIRQRTDNCPLPSVGVADASFRARRGRGSA